MSSVLSEYEEKRAKNIERNNARLRELGLMSALEERQSNDAAWGRRSEIQDDDASANDKAEEDDDDKEEEEDDGEWVESEHPTTAKKRKKRASDDDAPVEGSRKSRRLQGIGADGTEVPLSETSDEKKERVTKEREETVRECREVRLRAARAVAEAGAEEAAKENATATYEHALMRVRTMTEKRLAGRVKAIERACGRHCVVKMAIFKSCLQDEEKWELAGLASEALERLKGLHPPADE